MNYLMEVSEVGKMNVLLPQGQVDKNRSASCVPPRRGVFATVILEGTKERGNTH